MKLQLKDKYKNDKITIKKYYYTRVFNGKEFWHDYKCFISDESNILTGGAIWTSQEVTNNEYLLNDSELDNKYLNINTEEYDDFSKECLDKYKSVNLISSDINGFNGETYSWQYFIQTAEAKKIKNIDSAKLKMIRDKSLDSEFVYDYTGGKFVRFYPLKDVIELANSGITHNQARLRNIVEK